MFSLDNFGTLTTKEARERESTGLTSNTIDVDTLLDLDGDLQDTEQSLLFFLNNIGIIFLSTDGLLSIYSDGSIECPEFIEGSRVYIDNQARLTVVFLKETA